MPGEVTYYEQSLSTAAIGESPGKAEGRQLLRGREQEASADGPWPKTTIFLRSDNNRESLPEYERNINSKFALSFLFPQTGIAPSGRGLTAHFFNSTPFARYHKSTTVLLNV